MLLLASVGVYKSLPQIGKGNYREGQKLYEKGLLEKAKAKYEQAAKIDPNNWEIQIALGQVYESLGDLDQASKEYKRVLELGEARAFNNLGRVYISKNDMITAESLLLMGLQRVTKEPKKDFQLNYELHLNLGWLLLRKKQYQAAEKELRQAVAIDQAIEGKELGGGMAYCLLEDVLEEKKDIKEQLRWKNMCLTYARPETLDQYKWFIETGKEDIADQIDTTGVVDEESKPSTQP
jgi:Flp pilus assembly protein TadD